MTASQPRTALESACQIVLGAMGVFLGAGCVWLVVALDRSWGGACLAAALGFPGVLVALACARAVPGSPGAATGKMIRRALTRSARL